MAPLCLAYYCSGHGYGHATRVSAFACHLLSLSDAERPVVVHIVSSAPQHVFAQSIALGAKYRYAQIDPVIVQPLAYRVDRGKSVQALQAFLEKKDILLQTEKQWLSDIHANAVLSDAAFLGCQAAKLVGIPSILVTNFTFDSVYSYLSTSLCDVQDDELIPMTGISDIPLDSPITPSVLKPLVDQIHFGYQCADLLVRLPGHIPIPSFTVFPPLPSSDWVDVGCNQFLPEILDHLEQPIGTYALHPPTHITGNSSLHRRAVPRAVISAPLFVRPPSSFGVYSPEGRGKVLTSIGIPKHLWNPQQTKILIVSFGGQFIRGPNSRSGSRSQSRSTTPNFGKRTPSPAVGDLKSKSPPNNKAGGCLEHNGDAAQLKQLSGLDGSHRSVQEMTSPPTRRGTPSHIWVSSAPPALRVIPPSPLPHACSRFPSLDSNHRLDAYTPDLVANLLSDDDAVGVNMENEPLLLPDPSWIAVICGVSKEQWISQLETGLPNNFFVAPRDVYMPDLTAVGDVLLGKLGYGTVSECVDAGTSFVYVSRPLFIEEHGLRLLLEKEGVGIELSRSSYEGGDWADTIHKAWELGKAKKAKKRQESRQSARDRQQEMHKLAEVVLKWTGEAAQL